MWRTVLAEFERVLLGPKSAAAPADLGPKSELAQRAYLASPLRRSSCWLLTHWS